jgi:S-(hydroxymethyl)glutathione dehydrogenase/alcohol dehydrogenase
VVRTEVGSQVLANEKSISTSGTEAKRAVKGAVLREHGRLNVEELKIDDPAPREVRIRTMATGLCGSDRHFIEGRNAHPLPVVMGHEGAGIVEAVGIDVTYVVPGDHVVTFPAGFCGACAFCVIGRPTLCTGASVGRRETEKPRLRLADDAPAHQFAGLATFAEELLVHESAVVKIRRDVPFDRSALVGCGVATGLGAVLRCARVEPGAVVAVIGCGGIGLNAIQGAVIAGASRVIAFDHNAGKLERARTFGASDTVDTSRSEDVLLMLHELLPGRGGVDYSFEAVGSRATYELAFRVLRRGGTATMIGMLPDNGTFELSGPELVGPERRVQGTNLGSVRFREDLPYFLDLYVQGRLKLDELISQRISLSEINEGYSRIADGDIARSVVVFE